MSRDDLAKAALKLANAVEHDMNGTMGKGGNGGLLSDTTLRAAHEVHAILNRPDARHADDIAVDQVAAAMKAKLAKKRDCGLDIWRDNEKCSQASLSQALAHHVQKGDPIDVANFAMMLHQRGETIALDFKPSDLRKLEAEGATPLPYPNELTGDLKTVLSKMLWETGPLAEILRAGGDAIPYRAEDEQAHVLHWLIKLLLKHGEDYRTVAVEHLRFCDAVRIANRDGGTTA